MAAPFDVSAFTERITTRLAERGTSQNQLARDLGISRSTVSGWIRYGKLPDAATLAALCRALDCTADWLLGLDSQTEKSDPSGSIRWEEQLPPYLTGFQREQIELGIHLFNRLVGNERSDREVVTRYNLRFLQFAVQAAFRSGAIRLTHVDRESELEADLKRRFPLLKDVVVADVPDVYDGTIIRAEMVAFLAATDVMSHVVRENAVGLGTGYTMLRTCENSVPSVDQFKGTKWLPLVAYTDDNLLTTASGYTANQLAHLMHLRHPDSEAVFLPHPSMCQDRPDLQAAFDRAQSLISSVQTMFFTVNGVGRRDRTVHNHPLTDFRTADYAYDSTYLRDRYAELNQPDRFGGELLSVMIDVDGQPIATDEKRVWTVDLDVLRYNADLVGRVCVVAARDYKAQAVETCLRTGLANAVVIDAEIAREILDT